VDHEPAPVRQLEPDDLQQVARSVRADRQDPRWVRIRLEVDHDDGVVKGMSNGCIIEPVLVSRPVDVDAILS
jgi:hypothetical protein